MILGTISTSCWMSNQLLQVGVMLSTATVVLTAGIVVVSLFGMNIRISIMHDDSLEIKF